MSAAYPGRGASVTLSVVANDELMAMLTSGPLDEAVIQLNYYSDKFVSLASDTINKRQLQQILKKLGPKAHHLWEQLNEQLGDIKLRPERLWVSVVCIDDRVMGCINAAKRMVLFPPYAGPSVNQLHEVTH